MTTIEVDRNRFPAKYIGQGNFSKVYQVGSRAVYYTKGDCAKEVLAMFGYDRIAHLPEMIRHDNVFGRGGVRWYVFSSPFYRNVTRKDRSAYELRRRIMELMDQFSSETLGDRRLTGLYRMEAFEVYVRGSVPRSVSNALVAIIQMASNCGDDVGFDFHAKNFGVNEYGTLIFRDAFYVYER